MTTLVKSLSARRAWIEIRRACCPVRVLASLSARRAWIEIGVDFAEDWLNAVALRKESVDRNEYIQVGTGILNLSLSARRAWIEMLASRLVDMSAAVALRKESVDRNSSACSKK